ncbi:MAG: type II toxin-antitoxin system PemK/MazF family toxin [Saprospiraceae bacterium]
MPTGSRYLKYDIWSLKPPNRDAKPVVVIQNDRYSSDLGTVIVCPLLPFQEIHKKTPEYRFAIIGGMNGLPADQEFVAVVDQIFSARKNFFSEKHGELQQEYREKLDDAIRRMLVNS